MEFQGRTWVTRPHPYVDRLACAWLIHRFVDPRGKVRYRDRPRASEVAFDMSGGDYQHVGPLCTFEGMLQTFGLGAPGLRAIADIVHEIDLRDGLAPRPETAGVEAILAGWLQSGMDDHALGEAGIALFDGLRRRFSTPGE
ncbi:MAG: chromate resistance protein ChrB domain-containing protein [Dehalococcoidia bacterium]